MILMKFVTAVLIFSSLCAQLRSHAHRSWISIPEKTILFMFFSFSILSNSSFVPADTRRSIDHLCTICVLSDVKSLMSFLKSGWLRDSLSLSTVSSSSSRSIVCGLFFGLGVFLPSEPPGVGFYFNWDLEVPWSGMGPLAPTTSTSSAASP